MCMRYSRALCLVLYAMLGAVYCTNMYGYASIAVRGALPGT